MGSSASNPPPNARSHTPPPFTCRTPPTAPAIAYHPSHLKVPFCLFCIQEGASGGGEIGSVGGGYATSSRGFPTRRWGSPSEREALQAARPGRQAGHGGTNAGAALMYNLVRNVVSLRSTVVTWSQRRATSLPPLGLRPGGCERTRTGVLGKREAFRTHSPEGGMGVVPRLLQAALWI